MLLKEIIYQHHSYSRAGGLKENLGDAYLLENNPVFMRVRQHALRLGYRFSTTGFKDFDVLPLTQLPKILKKKTIPYRNNVAALMEIENTVPDYFQWQEVPPLKENFILHESAHAIAYSVIMKNIKIDPYQNLSNTSDLERTLLILTQEAFANACESIANIFSTNRMHDEFLYKNSYIMEKGKSRVILRNAHASFGISNVFQFVFISFLYANYLKTRCAMKDFSRVKRMILGNTKTSRKDEQLLKDLFQIGFDLDPAFTISTNQFCLRLLGIKSDFYSLLEPDILKYFQTNKKYKKTLADFTQIVSM